MSKRQQQWLTGRISSVPCPWCNKRIDFSDEEELLTDRWSMADIDAGVGDRRSEHGKMGLHPWVACDHCGKGVEVVKVERAILVSVRRTNKGNQIG